MEDEAHDEQDHDEEDRDDEDGEEATATAFQDPPRNCSRFCEKQSGIGIALWETQQVLRGSRFSIPSPRAASTDFLRLPSPPLGQQQHQQQQQQQHQQQQHQQQQQRMRRTLLICVLRRILRRACRWAAREGLKRSTLSGGADGDGNADPDPDPEMVIKATAAD
ncbi:putative potassium transport protein DDB_G0292412 [Drosophila suzukii]|uniref:Potassium transport protein DDB_G0292412 n=1 Tax=Drosophila suzukii TaxID=28584 RepID=A0ABM4TSR5_DROSZ